MRKLREKWSKIPRPLRAVTNSLLILLLLFLKWDSRGRPLPVDEWVYRRMEQQQMLGPGTIVHELNSHYGLETAPIDQYNEFAYTIVSETENGIIFCGLDRYTDGKRKTVMTYQEKTGNITLAVPPTDIWDWANWNWEFYLPIYVFHEHPDAVRAEVDLTIRGVWETNYNSDTIRETHQEPYEKTYSLKSIHQTEDFFLFRIEVPDIIEQAHRIEGYLVTQPERVFETMQGVEGDAPQLLSRLLNPGMYANVQGGSAEGTIRLYDEDDNLIAQQPFRYWVGEDYANKEVPEYEN